MRMNRFYEFIKTPRKTAILGLVGCIVMFISSIMSYSIYKSMYFYTFFIYNIIADNIFKIGLIIYFTIITTRIFFKKGSLKIANFILVSTLILFIINAVISKAGLIQIAFFVIFLLYFFNILFGKKTYINNKVFAIVFIINSILICISFWLSKELIPNYIYWIINNIVNLSILPYFYGYYELLKGEK